MATVNQIYALVNSVARQALGQDAITVTDTSTLVALGDFVLKSDTNTDLFRNALVDRIGRTVVSIRAYKPNFIDTVKEGFEYGTILQKIYVDLPDAKDNTSWEIGKPEYEPKFAPVYKPNFNQKLFSNISTFEIAMTVPDEMLKTAFLNERQMAVFIDGLFIAIENRMNLAIEETSDLVRASFIARKLHSGKATTAINLLHEYNTLTNAGLTVESALRNTEFLKWASMTINLFVNRMKRMSTLFNEEGYKRHTPLDDMVVVMLDNFTASVSTYLESDTFHNELVKLPMFKSVPYWQGSGTDYSFDSVSSIKIKLDATTTVEESGIVGVIYDYQALGVTFDKPKATNERNNHDEYTNYYYKFNKGYFNDMSENGIVFYLKEQA